MFRFFRNRKRKKLAARPFPTAWTPVLEARMSWVRAMPEEELARWRTHMKVFYWEKHWIGAKGLEVTEEMKLIISAQAARIARNLPLDVYDRLTEIVIYPGHYKHPGREGAIIYGEAHHWGTVVLSWDAVRDGIANPTDGHDTTIHELAHVLDVADGWFDGTPELHDGRDFHAWARVLGTYFAELQDDPDRGVVRAYGAVNEAEFFAVATEAFFERPKTMRRKAPELYRELKRFYQVDPARKSSASGVDNPEGGKPRRIGRRKRRVKRRR